MSTMSWPEFRVQKSQKLAILVVFKAAKRKIPMFLALIQGL